MTRTSLLLPILLVTLGCSSEGVLSGAKEDDVATAALVPFLEPGDVARVCADSGLNQRSGPGTGYARLRTMPDGAIVTILDEANGWYLNDWDGRTGWSSGQYLCAIGGGGGGGGGGGWGGAGDDGSGWSCDGSIGATLNPQGLYYTSAFGCWIDEYGEARDDPGDNCQPACQGRPGWSSLCGNRSGPSCERYLNWFAAGADRFGCLSRIRVTNEENGRSAVLAVLDRGPACWVEEQVGFWVLDVSYPASTYLFGGTVGASDRQAVFVEPVSSATPLGPTSDGWGGGGGFCDCDTTWGCDGCSCEPSNECDGGSSGGGGGCDCDTTWGCDDCWCEPSNECPCACDTTVYCDSWCWCDEDCN